MAAPGSKAAAPASATPAAILLDTEREPQHVLDLVGVDT
jgi:hypothetical protein